LPRFTGFVCILFFFPALFLYTRDLDDITAAEMRRTAAEETEETEATLLEKTLRIDIDTAGYFELLAWCKRAGLPEQGDKKTLAGRLYSYYNIPPEKTEEEAGKGKKITIESAKTTDYFTVEEVEEDYIIVKGDVIIRILDEEKGSEHSIRAEEIYFNQTKNILAAEGNVVYTLTENGKEETFFGKSLHFSLDTWEGVFFQGVSVSDQQIEEETVTFRYYGDTIYRSEKDAIRLEDGIISSSKPKEPYYRIEAKKIWVLAPGEWAILGASIYVGEIPMMYLPFFFRNRDKVVFRPSMGFRDKGGFFLQTTTYFIGEADPDEDTLSFLQLGAADDGTAKKVLKGIYLRSEGTLTREEQQEKQALRQAGTYGKLMFDAYSRLGVFTGLDINIGETEWLKNVVLFAGIARSRDIFIDPETGWYTPYWVTPEGAVASRWNTSYIAGNEVPFRYGMQAALLLSHPVFSIDGNIETFSDPSFSRDFFDRREETDWREFIGISEEADLTEGPGETVESAEGERETNRLSWYARGKLTPKAEFLHPYVTDLQISRADVGVNWKTKEMEITDENLPAEESRTEYSLPEKRFFYPDTMLLPSAAASLSGQVVNVRFPRDKKKPEEEEKEREEFPGKGLLRPWPAAENPDTEAAAEEGEIAGPPKLRVPDSLTDAALPKLPGPVLYRQSLSYSLKPSVSVDHRLNSGLWESHRDIDFAKKFSLLYTQNSFEVSSQSDFYNSLAAVKDTVTLSGAYKDHFNRSDDIGEEEWANYKLDDYTATAFLTVNDLTAAIKPFMTVAVLEQSAVTYNLQTVLFKKEYSKTDENGNPVFTDSAASWDKEFIPKHSLSSNVILRALEEDQKLSLEYVLPPLLQLVSARLTLQTGPFGHYIAWSTGEKELEEDPEQTEWKMNPLELQESFSLKEYLLVRQRFLYSFEFSRWSESKSTLRLSFFEKNLTLQEVFIFGFANDEALESGPPLFDHPFSSVTELKIWWFSAAFRAKNTYAYEIDPAVGWVQQEEQSFQPESVQFALQYKPRFDPFWKNRLRFGINLQTAWNISLLQYTSSSLSFQLDFTFAIHEFLKISFGIHSENTEMYRYFQKPCDEVGVPKRRFGTDLLKSLNIFSMDDRVDSPFNARSVTLSVVHHLRDWDLNIDYSGSPLLETGDGGMQSYKWDWSLSFYVQWNPIPELKRKIQGNDEEIIY
jgi:lipopolysaccharide assembly outer membrane protein LptD (OstA)